MTDVAKTMWEEMIRAEAEYRAERENECTGCCGAYGTETWLDYEAEVRAEFETIGRAYAALAGDSHD